MSRIALASLLLTLSVLAYGLGEWFAEETRQIASINQKHLREIEKLKKIAHINKWLQKYVKPSLEHLPQSEENSDKALVAFFDRHAKTFHFTVERFLYTEQDTHNMDISFELMRNERKKLQNLVMLRYPKGFLDFTGFNIDKEKITGTLKVIQPYFKDANVSH